MLKPRAQLLRLINDRFSFVWIHEIGPSKVNFPVKWPSLWDLVCLFFLSKKKQFTCQAAIDNLPVYDSKLFHILWFLSIKPLADTSQWTNLLLLDFLLVHVQQRFSPAAFLWTFDRTNGHDMGHYDPILKLWIPTTQNSNSATFTEWFL